MVEEDAALVRAHSPVTLDSGPALGGDAALRQAQDRLRRVACTGLHPEKAATGRSTVATATADQVSAPGMCPGRLGTSAIPGRGLSSATWVRQECLTALSGFPGDDAALNRAAIWPGWPIVAEEPGTLLPAFCP